MSLSALNEMLKNLPFSLKEQIVGYAQSIDRSQHEIFHSAKKKYNKKLADKLIFICGLKKFCSIVEASYWTLTNSSELLKDMGSTSIRVGGKDYQEFKLELYELNRSIQSIISKYEISQYMHMSPTNILEALSADEN